MNQKFGHYSALGMPAAIAAFIAVNLLGITNQIVTTPITVAMFVMFAAQFGLHQGLCERCVSRTPLDGSAKAEQRRRLLKLMHGFSLKGCAIYLLVTYTALWVVTWAFDLRGTYGINAAQTLLTTIPMLGVILLGRMHSKLMPWCPFCRWGRGGDGPPELVPDPDPSQGRPSPVT